MTELGDEAEQLTYDSVHWAEVVNLLKAQILFNDIEANLPDVDAVAPARRVLGAWQASWRQREWPWGA